MLRWLDPGSDSDADSGLGAGRRIQDPGRRTQEPSLEWGRAGAPPLDYFDSFEKLPTANAQLVAQSRLAPIPLHLFTFTREFTCHLVLIA